jgi:hypothetical protein
LTPSVSTQSGSWVDKVCRMARHALEHVSSEHELSRDALTAVTYEFVSDASVVEHAFVAVVVLLVEGLLLTLDVLEVVSLVVSEVVEVESLVVS